MNIGIASRKKAAQAAARTRLESDSGASLGWRASIQRASKPAPTRNAEGLNQPQFPNSARTRPVDSSTVVDHWGSPDASSSGESAGSRRRSDRKRLNWCGPSHDLVSSRARSVSRLPLGAVLAPASSGRVTWIQFTHLPDVPSWPICVVAVSLYLWRALLSSREVPNDPTQTGLSPKLAVNGLASWSWTIPNRSRRTWRG